MNIPNQTASETHRLRLSFGGRLPRLCPGAWTRFIYYLFEPLWWSIWFRHGGSVHGRLPDCPFVLVANHSSYLDWLLHAVLRRCFGRKIRFLAKGKVVRNPLFRVLVRATESIVVEETRKARALPAAIQVFTSAKDLDKPIVGIFPEGTRSRNGEPLPAFAGAARIASRSAVAFVPVALVGFFEAWPSQSLLPRLKRRHLSIHFLSPLDCSAFPDDQAATDAAMTAIYEVVRQERAKRKTS